MIDVNILNGWSEARKLDQIDRIMADREMYEARCDRNSVIVCDQEIAQIEAALA